MYNINISKNTDTLKSFYNHNSAKAISHKFQVLQKIQLSNTTLYQVVETKVIDNIYSKKTRLISF